MVNLLFVILGTVVVLFAVSIPLFFIQYILEKTKMTEYGIKRIMDPIICFAAIGVLVLYRSYGCRYLYGVYLHIFNVIIAFLLLSCTICIIADGIADIKDQYGMKKSDYVIRVILNLVFLITIYGVIYWFLFSFSPQLYNLGNVNLEGTLRQFWQFWFYSFHIAITYADGTIVAVGIPVQMVQVTEVVIFYFVIAKNIESALKTKH